MYVKLGRLLLICMKLGRLLVTSILLNLPFMLGRGLFETAGSILVQGWNHT